jgi:type I restriction enzyme, S subunit
VSDLPNGWTTAVLEDLGSWGSGGTPKRTDSRFYVNGTIPWLIIGDLNDAVVTDAQTYITEEGLLNSSAKLLPRNTLLIAMYGSIGKLGITGIECATNQAIAFCIPDNKVVELRYLFYALKNSKDKLIAQGQGVAQKNISQTRLKTLQIPIAPRREQDCIADKLDALLARVDACRDRLDRIPHILKRFQQSVLNAAISGQLTEDLRVVSESGMQMNFVSLSEVLLELKTGPFGSTLHQSDYVSGMIPIVNPMHINEGRIVPSSKMTVSHEKAEILSDFKIRSGDVIIARRGVMGRCAVVRDSQEGWICGTGSMILRPNPLLLPEYLQIFLSCPSTVKTLESEAVGSTMANLNQRVLSSLQIWLPPLSEQHEIVRRVKALFTYNDLLATRYQRACSQVKQLTPALLNKAFSGELVSQNLNDESALLLLERIRAMRTLSEESTSKSPRPRQLTQDQSPKTQSIMLTPKDIQPSHLSDILRARGSMTSETLWSASQLEIDEFYDQLKEEEVRGFLKETRDKAPNIPRLLEAV